MRNALVLALLVLAARTAAAADDDLPRSVAEAQALLRDLQRGLEAYVGDREATAAAPDAIRQADEAIAEAGARLAEVGVAGAAPEIRRAKLLIALIGELVEARALERAADEIADRVVGALERLAVVRAAWERVTEQLQLFAVPMPGEAGR